MGKKEGLGDGDQTEVDEEDGAKKVKQATSYSLPSCFMSLKASLANCSGSWSSVFFRSHYRDHFSPKYLIENKSNRLLSPQSEG